jgi:transcription elongation factor Elf1
LYGQLASKYNIRIDTFADLSAAVDVYSDWIDACDAVAKDAAGHDGGLPSHTTQHDSGRRGSLADDDGIIDDEEDGEADYGD